MLIDKYTYDATVGVSSAPPRTNRSREDQNKVDQALLGGRLVSARPSSAHRYYGNNTQGLENMADEMSLVTAYRYSGQAGI